MTKLNVLMPQGLKIDQACALALLLEVRGVQFSDVNFFFHDLDEENVPEDVYDLDARVHYPRGKSATEVVAEFHGITNVGPLIGELARNNQTGFMRSGEGSIAILAQKVYQLRASTTPERDHRLDVLSHYVQVGQAYLHASRAGRLGAKAHAEILGFTANDSKRIHHLSGYLAYLMEQDKIDEAETEMEWWQKKFAAAERATDRAADRVAGLPELKGHKVGDIVVASTEAKADEVARELFKRFPSIDVLLAISPDYVALLPNFEGASRERHMKKLYAALERLEPGAWHYEARGHTGMLLNGSARRKAAAPTVIGRDFAKMREVMTSVWK